MKPTRAGVIGLWDYTDHTFGFADGRIVLRGANGSGKTKALEVLFPFVLDGRLDARRLDPFSGENRTMKENLLWGRAGEAGYGYAWIEFGDGNRHVTVGVGLVARRSQPTPKPWFFVADGRVGDEVVLVEPDGRPRTHAQLRDALGDAVVDRAREHRARVDAALFGLGTERYEAMLDLVLTLRRPMLAKDLDPGTLSDTLARGLRPLDDGLLEQVARSFDDLEAVQRDLEQLARADDATQRFLTDYRGYLRTQARARADAAIEANALRGAASDRLSLAHTRLDESRAGEALAEAEATAAGDALARSRSRRDALRDSDAFRSAADLEHLARSVRDLEAAAERAADAANRATDAETAAADELARAERAAREAMAAVRRLRPRAAESAATAGISWPADDGGGDHEGLAGPAGRELRARANGGVAARRADIETVRASLDAVADTERRMAIADAAADRAREAQDRAEEALAAAEAAIVDARALARTGVETWAETHARVVDAGDAAALVGAFDAFGDPDGAHPAPADVWRDRVEPERDRAVARRSALGGEADRLAEQRRGLAERRDAIAAEADDAPPPLPWRGAGRDGRPGGPLWRLVRFADHVGPSEAAGYEAALEAAGLLDAWVRPDGTVDADTTDAYLDAGRPEATGTATLAAVLVAESHDDVAPEVIDRLLGSIGIDEISRHGDYRLGPLAGRHCVDAPRYIGATARAAHRAARLAALDDEIAALDVEADGLAAELGRIDRWLADVEAATAGLPPVTGLAESLRRRDHAAGRLQAARGNADETADAAERARREHNDRRMALQRDAAVRHIPPSADGLRDIAAAVDRFMDDARDLADAVDRSADRAGAAGDATRRHAAAQADATEAAADLAARAREHAARAAELATRRDRMGEASDKVLAELATVEAEIEAGEANARRLGDQVQAAAAARGQAEGEVGAATEALNAAGTAAAEAARRLAVLRRPGLAGPLGLDPAAVDAVDDSGDPGDTDGEAFLMAVDELVTGVSAVDERRKAAQTRVHRSLEELEHALGPSYRPSWVVDDDLIIVTVGDDAGVHTVAAFAAYLAAQRADQEVLLHARERALFEDALLSAVCRQIHDRIQSTRDLVSTMDQEMRARRLSSGQTVGIAWRATDAASPEWRAVHRLLDGDPAHFAPDDLETIRRHFGSEIKLARAGDSDVPYRDLLARVLDYRSWRRFELTLVRNDGEQVPLTKARHAQLSGGEKAATLHLPLFAAAHAAFAAARPGCPRLLALDEAFAGIDDQGRSELLSLTAVFDLDLFMTGFDLWANHPSIPAVAHHDLLHLADEHAVSSLLVLWNGRELVEGPDAEHELAELRAR
jgi:uncharacterized protein (TIGR02680 family)